jgi:diacylglycerol kinase family enzyme
LYHLSDDPRTVLIAANPRSGARSGRRRVERLAAELESERFDVHTVTELARLGDEACRAHDAGSLRAVIAAGGDGTVASVANLVPPDVPLAVFPLGTENLLAKHLGMRAHARRMCRIISDGTYVRLDAGRAGGRLFLLMLGCGFDAEVVRRLHSQRRGHIQKLAYAKQILATIRNYQYPEIVVRFECAEESTSPTAAGHAVLATAGSTRQSAATSLAAIAESDSEMATDADTAGRAESVVRAKWVFVANLPRYAGGLGIVPDADGADGRLDVCTFREGSFITGLYYLGGVLLGRHRLSGDCTTRRVRRVRLESEQAVYYQLDGDPGGQLPVDIEVLPERVSVLVSRKWAEKNATESAPAGVQAFSLIEPLTRGRGDTETR